ncbi:BgTH12-05815 [Blumeria graminis f. sp. triticale]|uniref:chitinase n=4 Tax=Blumeria graminis TaxID=34373 RepID=A0A061HM23_BLUGR|nr:Sporulation-specific chitinase [Blumeria graminis f. sp. tritici 96224]CAD6504078.1 BgTH12-05815 [Blumeria graminis f. sp. triticale]VDB90814.1 Bgt-1166 [Blumeria graminis f. sp. tritici]
MVAFLPKILTSALCVVSIQARYVFYYDQYHIEVPNNTVNAGIDHVITAFANSSLFTTSPAGEYVPFLDIPTVRSKFDNGTKVLIAIGGWSDTAGFSIGSATEASRKLFAANIASLLDQFDFDGVDIDWEFPGGNGADYRVNPNSEKTSEIETYPLLLAEIRAAIGPHKLLTIATPGLLRDFLAYTPEKSASIWESVDWVNVMTYDLMNRRDSISKHHTDIKSSLQTIDYYINTLSLDPAKINLGFATYAKWFKLDPSQPCEDGLGCATVLLENADGSDAEMSGAVSSEAYNYLKPTSNLTESNDGSCGPTVSKYCAAGLCCSQYGYCGDSSDYCNACLGSSYGSGCNETSISERFQEAMSNGKTDEIAGGEYYYDRTHHYFWTWDTPALIARKFKEIVDARNLGGVMAWSLGGDSYDYGHILALQKGVSQRQFAAVAAMNTGNATQLE